jgi:hypothetical protein
VVSTQSTTRYKLSIFFFFFFFSELRVFVNKGYEFSLVVKNSFTSSQMPSNAQKPEARSDPTKTPQTIAQGPLGMPISRPGPFSVLAMYNCQRSDS